MKISTLRVLFHKYIFRSNRFMVFSSSHTQLFMMASEQLSERLDCRQHYGAASRFSSCYDDVDAFSRPKRKRAEAFFI